MKKTYEHHYNKVTVPFFANIHELADFMRDDDYAMIEGKVERIGYTVTVEDEPADPDCGDNGGYRIIDWDIMPLYGLGLILFGDIIIGAVDCLVYGNEEEIVESEAVKRAFERFYKERESALKEAKMDTHYDVVYAR